MVRPRLKNSIDNLESFQLTIRAFMDIAREFLHEWVRQYLNPTVLDDKPGAEYLAGECMRDARMAGINDVALIMAARGDLTKYMLSKLNVAVRSRLAPSRNSQVS